MADHEVQGKALNADVESLMALDVLSAPAPGAFDALARLAADLCGVSLAMVNLLDSERLWHQSGVGVEHPATVPADLPLCVLAQQGQGLLEVADATLEPRISTHPYVTGPRSLRFYAGIPLRLRDGACVGTLCVADSRPRSLTPMQRTALVDLAAVLVDALEARRALAAQARQQMAAAEAQARFQTLSDRSPLGVFATDVNGACTYANTRWQAIFGLDAAQSLGDGWTATLHEDDRTAVFAEWRRAAKEGREFDMAFRIRRPDGAVCEVHSRAAATADAFGRVYGYVGSVEDITERLRTERELERERHRLASIVAGTGAGTWEWHVQTDEVRMDARLASMQGQPLEALQPMTLQGLRPHVHPGDWGRVCESLRAHLDSDGDIFDCELRVRHRDGHWVWVQDRGRVVIRTADGRPMSMFGIRLDISERKAREAELRETLALLDRTGAVAGVGGWSLDLASKTLRWSDQTCRIHGLPPGHQPTLEEAVGRYAPEAREAIVTAVERAQTEGHPWDLELQLVQVDGSPVWVRAVGQVDREGGVAVRLLGTLQDITAQVEQRRLLGDAHERIALATDNGGIGIWDLDLRTNAVHWDARMYRLYGLAERGGVEANALWWQSLHPEDRAATEAAVQAAIAGTQDLDSTFRILWPDGSVHHLRAVARVTRDGQGKALRMVGVNWDVTLLQMAAATAHQLEMLRVTMRSIGDAVITTDTASIVTWLNPVAERMTGWSSADAIGRPLPQVFHILHEDSREIAESPVSACLRDGRITSLVHHTVMVARDGREYGIEDSAAPICDAQGQTLGAVLVFHDVTEQRRLSGEMSFRATHDALTGLINRSEFEVRLRSLLSKAQKDGSEHALLYIDLDQFKLVNDACGHTAGDLLLQQVAKLLGDAVRSRDTLARLGGDEFALLLEHCNTDQAQRVGQQICDRMEQYRFTHDERRFRIGTSVGLVPVCARWSGPAAVMQAADRACYAAKEAGRNRVYTWVETDTALAARHGEMQWATRLEQALDDSGFELFFQRIQPMGAGGHADGAPAGGLHAEVLLRLPDGQGGYLAPGLFLPPAERFHLASRIDRWVLGAVLAWLGRVVGRPGQLAVSLVCVNLSGQSIGDRVFHRQAVDALNNAGPDVCRRLCLEITETATVTHMSDAALFIEQVRALGVRIALDDFGAGASSFGYLKSLAVDYIKIDGQFITGLIDNPLDAVAVRSFVDVARVVGVQTVAEFVDRPELLARLRDLGIDHAQGYLLHRPEPLARWV